MLHPEHLRQIYAYLARTRDTSPSGRAIDGVLLYPAIDASANQSIELGAFTVRVVRLSLSNPWHELARALTKVLFVSPQRD